MISISADSVYEGWVTETGSRLPEEAGHGVAPTLSGIAPTLHKDAAVKTLLIVLPIRFLLFAWAKRKERRCLFILLSLPGRVSMPLAAVACLLVWTLWVRARLSPRLPH